MASYQRVALYLLFDSIEQDLVRHIRSLPVNKVELTEGEQAKATSRILNRAETHIDADSEYDLLQGLDIADKYDVLLRHKKHLPEIEKAYFQGLAGAFKAVVPIRNSVMHARPLTIEEYSKGFSFAQTLLRSRNFWPILSENYLSFTKDPASFTSRSIEFLDDPGSVRVLHNLPTPEHDDTGFLPRPELERELKKRILGRHPVITILGEGGNGKTALALQTLYGLVSTNDHPFEAIIWYSAKTSMLTAEGVKKIGDDVVAAASIIHEVASLEPGEDDPLDRLNALLEDNRVLLVIDNLETVQGEEIQRLAKDIPGDSKLLLTSRVPLGGDLSVSVGELSDKDALVYMRRLIDAYEVRSLRSRDDPALLRYLKRLHNKPLLIKWFVLGVKSGATPDSIVANPETALKFCLENVVGRLGLEAKQALVSLATVPVPLSAQILEHVSDLAPREVEVALSELGRFGLADLVPSNASEQLYKLRPFARAYAMRVLSPKPELTADIRTRYNRVDSQFKSVQGLTNYNPYSLKNYKVRSPAEMLAANKLNRAVQHALGGDIDGAIRLIEGVRITDPGYFEAYRTQAYVNSLQGDLLASSAAYESALELAPNEPQLHFFYACMLMRGVNNELADHHFARALELDPQSMPAYREAARNCFVTYEFDKAEDLLEKAEKLGFKSYKDKVVYTDLRIQMYVRKIGHRIQAKDWDSASATVKNLALYVYSLDLGIFDERMVDHLFSVLPLLRRMIDIEGAEASFSADLDDWIRWKFRKLSLQDDNSTHSAPYRTAGALKQEGLQDTFGFLRSDDCRETFVHQQDAGSDLWEWMLAGGRVSYEVALDSNNKTRAGDIKKA